MFSVMLPSSLLEEEQRTRIRRGGGGEELRGTDYLKWGQYWVVRESGVGGGMGGSRSQMEGQDSLCGKDCLCLAG